MQRRLSDYVRAGISENGLGISTRAGTSRSDHFGDAQSVNLDYDEARELYEMMKDHFEE